MYAETLTIDPKARRNAGRNRSGYATALLTTWLLAAALAVLPAGSPSASLDTWEDDSSRTVLDPCGAAGGDDTGADEPGLGLPPGAAPATGHDVRLPLAPQAGHRPSLWLQDQGPRGPPSNVFTSV